MEMAERNPPYRSYHPVKAMFRVATKGAPPLKYPSKWTDEFKDFVRLCFIMDPKKRATAKQLSEHPFLEKACKKEAIAKIIEHVFIGNFLKSQGI